MADEGRVHQSVLLLVRAWKLLHCIRTLFDCCSDTTDVQVVLTVRHWSLLMGQAYVSELARLAWTCVEIRQYPFAVRLRSFAFTVLPTCLG